MIKIHRTLLAIAVAAVMTVGIAGFAGAQAAGTKGQSGQQGKQGHAAMGQFRHGKFGDRLGLSDAQKGRIKEIMTQAHDRRKAIWANDNQSVGALKNQLKNLREETKAKFESVLTPAQREKLASKHKGTKGGGKVVPPSGA